jgi:hypothetical protein
VFIARTVNRQHLCVPAMTRPRRCHQGEAPLERPREHAVRASGLCKWLLTPHA